MQRREARLFFISNPKEVSKFMKKIFGLALIATLLSPMACTKQEEAPATEEAAPVTEEAAPVTEEAAAPAEAAPAAPAEGHSGH